MNTSSTSFVKKAISALSAIALVASMVPATAFATEGTSHTTDAKDATSATPEVINETHAVEETSSASSQASASAASDTSSTAANAQANQQTSEDAKADIERVQATVTLGTSTTQTLFSFAGLNFSVNADGKTVSLIGVANTSLEGDIAIPAQVASNNTTYDITNISSTTELRGGGPRISVILQG